MHTPGNSSGVVDGAAAVLIGTKEAGEKAALKPRARIKSFASIGSEPTIMLTGPSFAAERALAKAGMKKEDLDIWELNEAFASVVLRFMDVLNVPHDRINVNGGAIAMGHPLGATGAMVLEFCSTRWSDAARRRASSRSALAQVWGRPPSWNGSNFVVMAGLDPAIQIFALEALSPGWPPQGRP